MGFIVEYPMSEKLLKKYIQLFVKNLDYSIEQGRAVVIEILGRMVEVLPVEHLQAYVQNFISYFLNKISLILSYTHALSRQ